MLVYMLDVNRKFTSKFQLHKRNNCRICFIGHMYMTSAHLVDKISEILRIFKFYFQLRLVSGKNEAFENVYFHFRY